MKLISKFAFIFFLSKTLGAQIYILENGKQCRVKSEIYSEEFYCNKVDSLLLKDLIPEEELKIYCDLNNSFGDFLSSSIILFNPNKKLYENHSYKTNWYIDSIFNNTLNNKYLKLKELNSCLLQNNNEKFGLFFSINPRERLLTITCFIRKDRKFYFSKEIFFKIGS